MESPLKNFDQFDNSRVNILAKSDVIASTNARKKMILDMYNFDQELVHSQDANQIVTRLRPRHNSFLYETLPNINRYDPRELQKYLIDFQRGNAFGNTVYSNIYDIALTSQDITNVVEGVSMSQFIMGFFQRYLVNWLELQSIKNVTTLVFIVHHYRRKYINLQFEYVRPFRNKFKKDADAIFNKLSYLNLIFYYDNRWIIATLNVHSRRLIIVDFIDTRLSKIPKDDMFALLKQFLEDEFGISIDNYDYIASGVVNEPSDCSFHVCCFMSKIVFESLTPEHVKYTQEDVSKLEKTIPWLIFKLRDKEPKRYHILRTMQLETGPGRKPPPAKPIEQPVKTEQQTTTNDALLQEFGISQQRNRPVLENNITTNKLIEEINNAHITRRKTGTFLSYIHPLRLKIIPLVRESKN